MVRASPALLKDQQDEDFDIMLRGYVGMLTKSAKIAAGYGRTKLEYTFRLNAIDAMMKNALLRHFRDLNPRFEQNTLTLEW